MQQFSTLNGISQLSHDGHSLG